MKPKVFKIVGKKSKQPKIDLVVKGMPEWYEVTYLGSIDSKTYFVIYQPEQFIGYEAWKVAIGPQDSMKVYGVHRVEKYRDGGAMEIYTERGMFRFPAGFSKVVKPSFEGKPIQRIFYSQF